MLEVDGNPGGTSIVPPIDGRSRKSEGAIFDPPSDEFSRRVVHGAVVTYASQAIRLLVQILSVIVMSRLLAPTDFGVFAMVTPVYGLALMFQDLGLAQATIQRPQITHAQVTALFWVNVAISLILAMVLTGLAPAVGWFYDDTRTASLTRGFAAIIVLSALASQHIAIINRQMRFHYLAVLDTVAFVLGFLGAVAMAVAVHNYWALFASPAIGALVTVIGGWVGTGFVPGLPRRERQMEGLLQQGGGITGFDVFNFLSRNLDNVLIGHAWGDGPLSLYDRAYKLLLFPLQQIASPLTRVMLPTLSRLQHDPDRYRAAFLRSVHHLLLVTQPGIVFTIATADILVPTLLGEAWRGAAPIFMWLGLTALLQPVSSATTWLFISQGRSKAYLGWGAFHAAVCTVAFVAGLPWGPIGVAAAYSVSQVFPRLPVMWWLATRQGPVRLGDLYRLAAPHAAASGVSMVAVLAFRVAARPGGVLGLGACLIVAYGAALLTLTLTPTGRQTLGEGFALIASAVRRV